MLEFVDDILVYSATQEDRIQHLHAVLTTLHQHSVHAKLSKCAFGTAQVEYLGNVLNKDGANMEEEKVAAVSMETTQNSERAAVLSRVSRLLPSIIL